MANVIELKPRRWEECDLLEAMFQGAEASRHAKRSAASRPPGDDCAIRSTRG